MGELVQEGGDLRLEDIERVGQAVVTHEFLDQLAPEFLDGVGPGRVGGQPEDLDGQLAGARENPLMQVDRPIIPDQEQPLGRVALPELPQALLEGRDPDLAAGQPGDLPEGEVEEASVAVAGVRPVRQRGARLLSLRRVDRPERRLAVKAELIAVDQNSLVRALQDERPRLGDQGELAVVGRIGAGDREAPALAANLQAFEQLGDAGEGVGAQPVDDTPQVGKAPARALNPVLARGRVDAVRESLPLRRGKNRDAPALDGSTRPARAGDSGSTSDRRYPDGAAYAGPCGPPRRAPARHSP